MSLGVTGKLILAFVTLLLGAVLIGTIATEGLAVTDTTKIINEQNAFTVVALNVSETEVHTVANAPTGWKIEDCPLTSVVIMNASDGTVLTADTDYTLTASTGTFLLINTSTTEDMIGIDNSTYLDYAYCGDDYLNLGWGRTLLNLVSGFFAIAILMASVGLFYSVGKDTGIV